VLEPINWDISNFEIIFAFVSLIIYL